MTNIKLSKQDEEELLRFLEDYGNKVSEKDINEIEEKLDKKLSNLHHKKKLPSFTKQMIHQVKDLAELLDLSTLPDYKHKRVVAALHYFVWAEDRIPDYIPIIGYLDDAFIVSVVYKEVKKDIARLKNII